MVGAGVGAVFVGVVEGTILSIAVPRLYMAVIADPKLREKSIIIKIIPKNAEVAR